MADLPDTPPWSPFRKSFARTMLGAGAAMVALGACPIIGDARAALLIDQGATLMMAAGLFVIGGASSERAAAWMGNRRGIAGAMAPSAAFPASAPPPPPYMAPATAVPPVMQGGIGP